MTSPPDSARSPLRGGTARRLLVACLIAALVAAANWAAWSLLNPPVPAAAVPNRVAGLAYNGFQRWDSPLAGRLPGTQQLDDDLRLLAQMTRRLRTYSASEFAQLPALARAHGIRLDLGVWLDRRDANNERELAAALQAAAEHPNVERLIIGNETQLHRSIAPEVLGAYLERARRATRVPVSTAEPWHVWLSRPELAEQVDFITVHLLPYWEGVPLAGAVDEALRRYAEVRRRFPHKPVVIGEIGWPSRGPPVGSAEAGADRQAVFVREFLARAAPLGLDYFLMEAVDQPWKAATEGEVGAHWGIHDAARNAKFAFDGAVFRHPGWPVRAALATALGVLVHLPFLLAFAHLRLPGRLAFVTISQLVLSIALTLCGLPLERYLQPLDVALLALLAPLLLLLAAMLLAQCFEFAELFWPGSLRRRTGPRPWPHADALAPMVSLHLACCNEPPAQVIATIDSLMALDWPDLEVLVVDNNTRDEACWRPVQVHVAAWRRRLATGGAAAGRRLSIRFFHLPKWPGFKAGALNHVLRHTDPRAAWIGVVDADYLVQPDWLRQLAGHFEDPGVGIVQAPQAHRGWAGQRFSRMMNWEFDGFFRIGMHHRHERDAIVQHGTMTLIRATSLRRAGGWDGECVCEDTELGLRILQLGQHAVYVDKVLGRGLVPADFAAYGRQRRRWAQGGMQILRRHAGALFGRSSLGAGQRYHFVAGWLPWIGDALHLPLTLAAIGWSIGYLLAPQGFGLPIVPFVVPLAVFLAARLLLGPLLYWRRLGCPVADIAGAALAGMALSHDVARGVIAGLRARPGEFTTTVRADPAAAEAAPGDLRSVPAAASVDGRLRRRAQAWPEVREQAALLAGLLTCIAALASRLSVAADDTSLTVWIGILSMQALPYGAALVCAALSRHDGRRGAPRSRRTRDAAPLVGDGAARALGTPAPAGAVSTAIEGTVPVRYRPPPCRSGFNRD